MGANKPQLMQSRAVRESSGGEVCRREIKLDLLTCLGNLLLCLTTLTVKRFLTNV